MNFITIPFDLSKLFIKFTILLGISLLILIVYFPVGGAVDLYLIQPWMDQFGHFIFKNNWYLVELNHHVFKNLLIIVYLSFFILWCASFKLTRLKLKQWHYGYMFWVSILSIGLIGILKAYSIHACPWNMVHTTTKGFIWVYSSNHGHCFPGGHASTGFALITGYFVYRIVQPKLAYFYLFSGLFLGFMMGWGQMMRGAHFLSHNLWTGWIILTLNVIIYACFYLKLRPQKISHILNP